MNDRAERTVHPRPAKRIIMLLDGTWNDQDFGNTDTNIVRLERIISDTLRDRKAAAAVGPHDPGKITTSIDDPDGTSNIVFYERGIGTSWADRLKGGIFGSGMSQKIRNAYRFLSFHYEPGAQVFVFGFSRGAYTARSLVGFIGAAGLLRCADCTPANEEMAWRYYKTPPNERLPGIHSTLTPFVHNRDALRITCLGVFDTVGALGIPLDRFKVLNRDRYEFHDVNLSSITELNLQAVAIDEHRRPFEAAVWRRPKFKRYLSYTEQVWFPGVHSDIGGSYIPEVERDRDNPQALDDLTLDWMLKRVTARYPDFPADPNHWAHTSPDWVAATQHESRRRMYSLMPLCVRSIGNYPIEDLRGFKHNGCYDRHAVPMWEMVHVSALLRLGLTIATGGKLKGLMGRYLPENLVSVLPVILATYGATGPDVRQGVHYQIRIVDWDGNEFDPADPDDCATAIGLVRDAITRMQ